jgi:hypothetical protein
VRAAVSRLSSLRDTPRWDGGSGRRPKRPSTPERPSPWQP